MVWFKRVLAVSSAVLAFAFAASAPTLAAGPVRQPVPTPSDLTIACAQGFYAVAHAVTNNEYVLSFAESNGTQRFMVDGHFVASLTGNGKSVVVNVSGPATFIFRADGSVTIIDYGRVFYITPDLTDALLLTGRVTVDSGGNILTHTGTTTDLCAALA